MRMQDMPIRRRLTLAILGVTLAAMLLMRAAFLAFEYHTFRQSTERHLASLGEILATNSTAALAFQNHDDAQEILGALQAERNIVAAGLYDRDGRLFARYPADAPDTDFPSHPGAAGYRFAAAHLAGFQPVAEKGRLGMLYLKLDLGVALREWLMGTLRIALAVMALVLLVAYLLSRAVQRQISEPIMALATTARAISERRDYSVRATGGGNDEVGQLTEAFNQMLAQIEAQNQVLREHETSLERRVAERTAELEVANQELEAFSYSVSHDLRAPLRHIDGFSQLLQKRAGPTLGATDRRYLNNINASAKGLGVLIDELLAFSRMGRAELRRSWVESGALVEEVVREFQPELGARCVEWRIAALPAIPADLGMLRQVWRNLLGNAVKYTRHREQAVIIVGYRLDAAEGHVFAVQDNGAGFDMQYAAKLFGVFQRLHHVTEFEGTGIGLANVRRIVHRHGGRCWAEGVVGTGATFHFSLPEGAPASVTLST